MHYTRAAYNTFLKRQAECSAQFVGNFFGLPQSLQLPSFR